MKISKYLIAPVLVLLGSALIASAQSNIKLLTADMARLYENYYRTAEAQARFQNALEQAQAQAEKMMSEGQAMVEDLRRLEEEAQNPALSTEARQRSEEQADRKRQEIREKEREVQQFNVNTQRALQQRQQSHRQLMMEEIREVVAAIARKHGANLILDSSGGATGVPSVLYSDAAFDVTEEILVELNKDKPAGS